MNPITDSVKILGGLAVGAPVGAVIFASGITANVALQLPKATYKAYKYIWQSKVIGPNLKTTASAVLPIGIALIVPTTFVAATLAGMGYGFWKSINSIPKGLKDCVNFVKDFNKETRDFVDKMEASDVVVKDEEVFDIRVWESIRGVGCAVVLAPVEAIGMTAALFSKWVQILFRAYRTMWEGTSDSIVEFTFQAAMTVLVTAGAILAIPLTPLCATLFSLGDMCYQGYKKGVVVAGKKSIERIKDFNGMLKDFLKETKKR